MTQFCTGCGMEMSNVDVLVGTRGRWPGGKTGVRHGFILLLVGLLLVPVWMFVGAAFPPNDKLIEGSPSTTPAEAIAWILMWVAFMAGVGRIAYSILFENSAGRATEGQRAQGPRSEGAPELPPGDDFQPAQAGRWKATDDLLDPVLNCARPSRDLG
jgi:hypothetical protein